MPNIDNSFCWSISRTSFLMDYEEEIYLTKKRIITELLMATLGKKNKNEPKKETPQQMRKTVQGKVNEEDRETDNEDIDQEDAMERVKIKETHHKDDDKDDEEKRNETGLARDAGHL